jgi:hypothetical protein
MELGNVLSVWAYNPKATETERHRLMAARRRARSLLVWVFDRYKLLDGHKEVDPMADFYWQYLAQLAKTIVFYKQQAEKQGMHNYNEHVTIQAVKKLVLDAVQKPQELKNLYFNSKIPNTNLVWKRRFTVEKIADPRHRKLVALHQSCSLTNSYLPRDKL